MKTLIVLCGPSGSGKTTLSDIIAHADTHDKVISTTTREMRPGEVNGLHYHFLDKDTFDGLEASGLFLETSQYGENKYGILMDTINEMPNNGVVVVDINGVHAIRKAAEDNNLRDIKPLFVFLDIDKDVIVERLTGRGDTKAEDIAWRSQQIQAELENIRFFSGYEDSIILRNPSLQQKDTLLQALEDGQDAKFALIHILENKGDFVRKKDKDISPSI